MVVARRVLNGFLLALLAGLVPAAYADPPDPTWVGGFWDETDFDTVVASSRAPARPSRSPMWTRTLVSSGSTAPSR